MNTQKATQEYRMNQWIGLVREYRDSGQTVISWCRDHDIDPRKYYYWLRKIRAAACKSIPVINGERSIVPLEIQETSADVSHSVQEPAVADIVIRLGSAVLEILNNASATLIENTIKALNNAR
jgi:transposase-like protein